jgi:hypothetical protein
LNFFKIPLAKFLVLLYNCPPKNITSAVLGERVTDSIVGDLIGKRGVVYAPINRAGVLFLFSRLLDEFDMLVEQIAEDCNFIIALRRLEPGWERVKISLALKSSDLHTDSNIDGDLLICWHHDWPECPLKTFELKALFENDLLSNKAKTSDQNNISSNSAFHEILSTDSGDLLSRRGVAQRRFEKAINELDTKIKNIFPEDT